MAAFLQAFWRRRDPDPDTPDNPTSAAFGRRVKAADRLYSEEGVRGALTDRGRALILLGSPAELRYARRAIPALDLIGRTSGGGPTRSLPQETWIYPREGLAEVLRPLADEALDGRVMLVFLEETRHTRLLEGEKLLQRAARALAGLDP